jgi:phospholipid N-methyltransferase
LQKLQLYRPTSKFNTGITSIMMNEPRAARPLDHNTFGGPGAAGIYQLQNSFKFLRGFIRHPAQVGSIIPSSHSLEQRLVASGRIAEAAVVAELGPGTGGTTTAFLRAMASSARLLAVELDIDFFMHLRRSIPDPRFIAELGSAESLDEFLAINWLPAPDTIVSGIPFSTMSPAAAQRVAVTVARVLRPGGRFVAYQVRASVAAYMSPLLGTPDTQWELANIPPVRVFTWTKPIDPQ